MRIYGNASPGGPASGRGVPLPTEPVTRPGSDIVSRLAAAKERVSPITLAKIRDMYVGAPSSASKPNRGTARIDRVEVAAQYRRGMSGPEIARLLGCTTDTVYKALDDGGVQRRPAHRHGKEKAS